MTSPVRPEAELEATYTIDAGASRFTVRAFAGGLLSVLAHNPTIAIREFSGEVRIDLAALERSSLFVKVDAASLTVTGDVPDKDRPEVERAMHEEVLQSGRFPEIVYECSRASASKTGDRIYWVSLNGQLSLHGVTRNQVIPARVFVDETRLKANGDFSIRQRDYDIKLVSAAGGTIKVKDELKLSFEIVARRQD
jgi:polyisoprenoid-binding protein YceI